MCKGLAFLLTLLVLASCGYRPLTARLPDGSGAVAVPLVENRTAFPGIASALTEALRIRTQESGLRVVSTGQGVHRLRVRIEEVESRPGMLEVDGDHLMPLEQVWLVRVEASLEDPAGKTVRGPKVFEACGRSLAAGNASADEAMGQSRRLALQDDVAEAIVDFMFLSAD